MLHPDLGRSAVVHDAAARDGYEAARWACWAEPDWDAGVAACLARLTPLRYLPPGSVVLDVGCGVGRLLVPLAIESPEVDWWGFDPSAAMIGHAVLAARDAGARITTTTSWEPLGVLDGAYSVAVLQHLPAPEQEATVARLGRLVRPGGTVVLQWQHQGERGLLSHPVPVHEMIEWLVAAGFHPVETDTGIVFPTWAWAEARRQP